MSRQIDIYDHPLTRSEIDYLNARSRQDLITINARAFPGEEQGLPDNGEGIEKASNPNNSIFDDDMDDDGIQDDTIWAKLYNVNKARAEKMNVDALRDALASRKLATEGVKADLVERIAKYETDVATERINRNDGDENG